MWWAIIIAGIVAIIAAYIWGTAKQPAPLNASGYTYPSSPGA